MSLPAAESFCDCVMFGSLGTFRGYINAKGPERCARLFIAVGHHLLSSCEQRRNNKKQIDILTAKIKFAPRDSTPQISRK